MAWIEKLLDDTVNNDWCTKLNCTTCGAMAFKKRLRLYVDGIRLGKVYRESEPLPRWGKADADFLIAALAGYEPVELNRFSSKQDEAIMLILYVAWSHAPCDETTEQMFRLLQSFYSGAILKRMMVHYSNVKQSREHYALIHSPEYAAKRRAEKKAEKQLRHAERMRLQKIKNAAFYSAKFEN